MYEESPGCKGVLQRTTRMNRNKSPDQSDAREGVIVSLRAFSIWCSSPACGAFAWLATDNAPADCYCLKIFRNYRLHFDFHARGAGS